MIGGMGPDDAPDGSYDEGSSFGDLGPSAGGEDAYDASNTGIYGAQAPMGNVSFGSIASAIAGALGLGQPAKQTQAFPAGQSMAPKTSSTATSLLGMARNFSPTNLAMSLIANVAGNVPNEMMTQSDLNQGLLDQFSPIGSSLATRMGHPHTGGAMLGAPAFANEGMFSVPMSGSGAQMGIAVSRDPTTGLNMGPGRPGDPGDVIPYSGVMYGEGSDPYIRNKQRNIAHMVGGV